MTFTATVKAASPGSGTPTGTVTFYDGATDARHGHSQRRHDHTHDDLQRRRLAPDHGRLQRRRQLHHQHLRGADPDGQPGRDDDDGRLLGATLRSTGRRSRSRRRSAQLSRQRNTDRHGHVLLRVDDASEPARSAGESPASRRRHRWPAGNLTIKASYSGDTNFKTSSGTLTQTVDADSTTTAVVSSANPSVFGQSVTFTATVTANAPGAGLRPAR